MYHVVLEYDKGIINLVVSDPHHNNRLISQIFNIYHETRNEYEILPT